MKRTHQRAPDSLRPVILARHFTKHAEGSALVSFGDTKVICNVSIEESVPSFLDNKQQGWLTAEYGMLPRSTHTRMDREAARGKQSGRTLEIARLIGRALRMAVDLKSLGKRTLIVDCDVIQADGGTRTAAITGAMVAAYDALSSLVKNNVLPTLPIKQFVAAVSVGVYQGVPLLDLDYQEDSQCDVDMNVVMTEHGQYIEVQSTAEHAAFTEDTMNQLLTLAKRGIADLVVQQKSILGVDR